MFKLPRSFANKMIDHSKREAPNEACGLIVGKNGVPLKIYSTTNAEASPVHYLIEPREQLDILEEMDKNEWDLLAIYHSHPKNEANPSPTDIDMAYYHDQTYLIVSLARPDSPEIKAFRIADRKVSEEELVITDELPV